MTDMPSAQARPFLTARWIHLAMLNYEVDPDVLRDLVPSGTELDFWAGRCFVSIVGFQFLDTRVLGVAVPFHRDFQEVNLRFYVTRTVDAEVRRGVVFIRWSIRAGASGTRPMPSSPAMWLHSTARASHRIWAAHRARASSPTVRGSSSAAELVSNQAHE